MATVTQPQVEYPDSDGEPMAETPVHVEAIILLHQALQDYFRPRRDVFVASDIYWYWQEGNVDARISPDVIVVVGVPPRDPQERRSFRSWDEGGCVPAAVFEIAARGTWRADRFEKLRQYEALEVAEYFIFDPEARYVVPALTGFRLRNGVYTPVDESEPDTLTSDLGFRLRPDGRMLRLLDGQTGFPLPTRQERADALQAEVERLRALLEQPNPAGGGEA